MVPNTQQPTILTILGITGDLAAKKIIPALFNLHQKGVLPEKTQFIGFGRREFTQPEFTQYIYDIVKKYNSAVDQLSLEAFSQLWMYHQGLFEKQTSYRDLGTVLASIEQKWGAVANQLLYLSVPPNLYQAIFKNIAAAGLVKRKEEHDTTTRLLVEKPFGNDLETAEQLDKLLGNYFGEEQIYRIDHYLAKEMVQNILTFRFANDIFESTWNNQFIEKIEIRLWETLGVEHRGSFYDPLGTLRDVGQNHLLQMLALATMEYPLDFAPSALHLRRAQILSMLIPPTEEQIKTHTYRAQYDGYRNIAGVAPDSNTETYFKIRGELNHPKWQGIPILFESGKRMHEARKEIVVTYKHQQPCWCPPNQPHHQNQVIFQLEPNERITIAFWSKKPGLMMEREQRTIDFFLRNTSERKQYVEEYEKLLMDCIAGDQTLFISTPEVKAMWRFTDPITEAWQKNVVPLDTYKPDTSEMIEKSRIIEF